MIRALRFFAISMTLFTATGCAIGGRHDYGSVLPQLQRAESSACLVAASVQDQRREVLSGDKEPNFVGLSRGGYGNPFDVRTASDRALADDLSSSVEQGLSRAGYQVSKVALAPKATPQQALSQLSQTGARCLLLVTLTRLKSDTYQNTALIYDVEAVVMDRAGHALARSRLAGHDNLGGSAWNPPAHARREVPPAVERVLQRLLDDPTVVKALHHSERTRAEAGHTPRS